MTTSFFTELKKRNVFKVGIAYLVLAWVVIQVTDSAVPALHLPDWVNSLVFFLGALGFPFALFFAWAFEITPEGIKKESDIAQEDSVTTHTGRKLDFIIIGALLIIISVILYTGSFDQSKSSSDVTATTKVNKSVAVLPFVNMSSEQEYEWFSDGLTEEILNSLAMLQELQVTARTSSFYFKGKNLPVQEIAKKLGVEYIVEGSVRSGGDTLRITAQLIKASDGSHLWSDTYDRPANDVLTVQRDVAESIAKTLDVILDDESREKMFASGTRNVTAFEAYHRGFAHAESVHNLTNEKSLWKSNEFFAQAIAADPKFAAPHVDIQDAYTHFITEGADSVFLKNDGLTGLTQTEAFNILQFHQQKALELATTEEGKLIEKLSQTFLSEDWRELPRLLSEFRRNPSAIDIMNQGQWLIDILHGLGEGKLILPHLEKSIIQSPYSRQNWYYLTSHLITNNQFDEASKVIEQSKAYNLYNETRLIDLYMKSDNLAKLDELYELKINNGEKISIILLIATGRKEQALQILEQEDLRNKTRMLRLYYFLGLSDKAKALAQTLDKQPLGALIIAQYLTSYGRVDVGTESLPNYVRKLREAGLSEDKINTMFLTSDE